MSLGLETVATVAIGIAAVVSLVDDLLNNARARIPGRRINRNTVRNRSRIEALQARLSEGEARLNAMRAQTAAAEDAFWVAQDASQRIQAQLSTMEESFRRRNGPGPYPTDDARSMDDGHFRSTELDQREIEEERRQAEEDVNRALEERSRAITEATRARQEQEQALRALRGAEATAFGARAEQQEAEDNLRKGIRPVVEPTQAEFQAARERLGYQEGLFHLAIAGIAGSGKTSLVNAFRGLRNSDQGAAPTGIIETTGAIARYRDPNPAHPFVWYDVPGAGTLSVSDWQYFTDQGLHALDCVIVLFDIRLTSTDIAILRDSARFEIPAFIVRSKATQHIRNLAGDMPDTDDDDDDAGILERAREMYIQETRASVSRNLDAAGLSQQRVYMVDKDTLARIVKGRSVRDGIDENELLHDLLAEAHRRNARVDT